LPLLSPEADGAAVAATGAGVAAEGASVGSGAEVGVAAGADWLHAASSKLSRPTINASRK
jgi:hypothetical protein